MSTVGWSVLAVVAALALGTATMLLSALAGTVGLDPDALAWPAVITAVGGTVLTSGPRFS